MSQITKRYAAQEYVASSPDAEILGAVLLSFVQNVKADELMPFLKKYGLDEMDPNKWYPQQLILDFYKGMADNTINMSENMVAIGIKSVETVPQNPDAKTLEQAILTSNATNKVILRNVPEDEGFAIAESRPGYLLVIDNTPYPADAMYGYFWGLARRYKTPGGGFRVVRVDNPKPDQFPGRAFEITWN